MAERDGMFSQGPALPWKLDEEKLFKYKNEGSRRFGTGRKKLQRAGHIMIDIISLKSVQYVKK